MNRMIWVFLLVTGCFSFTTSGKNDLHNFSSVHEHYSDPGNKGYLTVQADPHTDIKIKFRKRRICDTAQVIAFHPEYNLKQCYFLHSYTPLKSQISLPSAYPGENIRRGPPFLVS